MNTRLEISQCRPAVYCKPLPLPYLTLVTAPPLCWEISRAYGYRKRCLPGMMCSVLNGRPVQQLPTHPLQSITIRSHPSVVGGCLAAGSGVYEMFHRGNLIYEMRTTPRLQDRASGSLCVCVRDAHAQVSLVFYWMRAWKYARIAQVQWEYASLLQEPIKIENDTVRRSFLQTPNSGHRTA